MERWSGRVAVVTGASAGIGAAIAQLLVKRGLRVVGLARRADNIQALADSLKDAPGKLYAVKADLSKEEDIMVAFQWVKDNLGGVDLLVNNAAVAHNNNLADGKTEQWRQLLEVNLLALSICTREALQSMKERSVDDGHIVHINSVAGHSVVDFPGIAFYSATKHGVTALTEGLRKELACLKSGIRVTACMMLVAACEGVVREYCRCSQSISPGAVDTDMLRVAIMHDEAFKDVLKDLPMLLPEDIAEAVEYAISVPARVQVHEITIHPTGEKF